MDSVSLYEARTGFSALIEQVQKGSSFVVTKRGRAVAKIAPVIAKDSKRQLGIMSLPDLPDSFFEPLPGDELALWGV
ncbi:MAG: type II toxin-antitoxin system prevent-host-death family antitoxin [Coriobacteriales bacterium]|jgi:prevent-host-death family protein|nr:type II toxin-antitoxin system prevent-host-death family antitoxin [Coriobacteriales bacterium]